MFTYRTGSIRPQSSSSSSSSVNKLKEKPNDELEDEAALQLALSLSRREAEEKERQKKLLTQQYMKTTIQYPPIPTGSAPIADDNEHKYWENQTKNDLITIVFHISLKNSMSSEFFISLI